MARSIGGTIGRKLQQKLKESKLQETVNHAVQSATETAVQTAVQTASIAKASLDQVLLNLEHRGLNVRDPQNLAQKVGAQVLERAETIRAQIAENPLSPRWVKNFSLTTPGEPSAENRSENLEKSASQESSERSENPTRLARARAVSEDVAHEVADSLGSVELSRSDKAASTLSGSLTDSTISAPAANMQVPSLNDETAEAEEVSASKPRAKKAKDAKTAARSVTKSASSSAASGKSSASRKSKKNEKLN